MRHSKIAQLGLARSRKKDVRRLDVAMNDAVRVRSFQSVAQLREQSARGGGGEWQALSERAALHILHRQKAQSLVELQDGDDVCVLQRRYHLRFANKSSIALGQSFVDG